MHKIDGYRANVGIIIANARGQVLWARRIDKAGWQFPQGGIQKNETPTKAMMRELYEETGLKPEQIQILAQTQSWLSYRLPTARRNFIGQRQKWFLLELLDNDEAICLTATPTPEFDRWCWVSYWYPVNQVVRFKQEVYRRALAELVVARPERSGGKRSGKRSNVVIRN